MIFVLAWNLVIFVAIIFFGFNVAFNLFSAVFTGYLVLYVAKNKIEKRHHLKQATVFVI